MTPANTHSLVSVIVPVGERQTPMADLYAEYKSGLRMLGTPYELIFVLDGEQPTAERALNSLLAMGEPITIVSLTRYFGEATALMIGFDHAAGDVVLTLPAYLQIEGGEIGKLVAGLGAADIVIGYREPRASSWFQTLRQRAFHGLLRFVTRLSFRCTATSSDFCRCSPNGRDFGSARWRCGSPKTTGATRCIGHAITRAACSTSSTSSSWCGSPKSPCGFSA